MIDTPDYVEHYLHLGKRLAQLRRELPEEMEGFNALHSHSLADGALSARTKELMALAIGIALRCEGCIVYHVRRAFAAGATREEFHDTLGVALLMGGAPAAVMATYALDVIEQFEAEG